MSKKHSSVGAIIRNEKGEILMMDRRNPPYGWAGPAGHIESHESPENALIREVNEETGLEVIDYKLLDKEFLESNICSRGVRGHMFYIFEVTKYGGELKDDGRESKGFKWYALGDLTGLKLEEAWKYFYRKLGYI